MITSVSEAAHSALGDDEPVEVAVPAGPAEVLPAGGADVVDLFVVVLADVADPERAVTRVEGVAPGVPEPVVEHHPLVGTARLRERVVLRDAEVRLAAEVLGVDTEQLARQRGELLGIPDGIACAATVPCPDI